MEIKQLFSILFLTLILIACNKDNQQMLIGEWRVDEVRISEQIDEIEEQDIKRMEGTVMEFKEDRTLQINMEGDSHKTEWSVNESTLEVKNGIKFKIQVITESKVVLEGELSYYKDGKMENYNFSQYMSKIQ